MFKLALLTTDSEPLSVNGTQNSKNLEVRLSTENLERVLEFCDMYYGIFI